jgi:hypothetical protein
MTDYRGNTPYIYFTEYKTKYAKGYHGQAQKNIGEKPGKGKNVGQGNNNKMKKDPGNGGGKGKKK